MKFICLIHFLFVCWMLAAQPELNLIPNPSFEDINICHKYTEPCSPKAWRSVVLKNVRYIAHEAEQEHFFPAADGERCIAFGVFNERKKLDRSFVQVPLLAQLVAGQTYEISFAFRPEQLMIGALGIYFADTLIIHKNMERLLEVSPQVRFEFDEKIAPETWQRVKAIYKATGNEKGLIVGNFNDDKNTQVTIIGKRPKGYFSRRVYYAFDDFKLQSVDNELTKEGLVVNKNFIYQDSFRHINKFGIPLVSMITTADSLDFYRRASRPKSAKKPSKITIADTEIKVNEAFIASAINFTNNSDQLLKSAYPTLEVVSAFLLKNTNFKLKIIGHTDNVGKPFMNQKLSEDRARAVVRYLINQGVSPKQLVAIGRGESEPIADNYSNYGRQQNRRVEFIFY